MKKLDLNNLSKKLCSSKEVRELVKIIKPLDMVDVLVRKFNLHPKGASKIAFDLIKSVEGLAPPAIERGDFPVPSIIRRNNEKEEHIARPQGKVDITPKFFINPHEFPPDSSNKPDQWPFDDQTISVMSPKNKNKKRSLTSSKKNKIKNDPLQTNIDFNQPGGDGAGGKGIYSKSNSSSGDMPGSGNNSWVAKGTKGWNSVPDKTFDVPPQSKTKIKRVGEIETQANAGDNDELEPQFLKNPNTGASLSVTNLGYGGRTPKSLSKTGYRGYGKK